MTFELEFGRRDDWNEFTELDQTIGEGWYGSNRVEGGYFDETIAGLPELDTSFLGVEIEGVSVSDCHVCVSYSYTMGYQKYGTTTCYLKPECRPRRRPELPGDPPPDLTIPDQPPDIDLPIGSNGSFLRFANPTYRDNNWGSGACGNPSRAYSSSRTPYPREAGVFVHGGSNASLRTFSYSEPTASGGWIGLDGGAWYQYLFINGQPYNQGRIHPSFDISGLVSFAQWEFATIPQRCEDGSVDNIYRGWVSAGSMSLQIDDIQFDISSSPPRLPQPPDEPPENSMNCCPEVLRRLRIIQNDLIILARWTGAKPGVMKVPKTLLKKDGLTGTFLDGLINLFDSSEMDIRSLPEFFKWQIERQQEFQGEWPIKVANRKGDEMALPNLAASLQQMLTKQVADSESDRLTQVAVCKCLLEVALSRHNDTLAVSALEAIIDFLGIPVREQKFQIRHQFTIPGDQDVAPEDVDTYGELETFLKSSEIEEKIYTYNGKSDGNKKDANFSDLIRKVTKILEIVEVGHWAVDKNNIAAGLKTKLKEFLEIARGENDEDSDINQWVEEVEQQFANRQNPPEDSDQPWGGNYSERPRIKIRGTNMEGS